MISYLLHEYEVKPSTSVNNYDITGLYHAKETEINTFSKYLLYFAKQDRYTLLEQSVDLSNWLFY